MFSTNKINWGLDKKSFVDEEEIVKAVTDNNVIRAKNLIDGKGYTERELNTIRVDKYANNLLHLTVMTENLQLTSYFLEKGVSFYHKNKFRKTAWEMAVESKNQDLIERFVLFRVKTENSFSLRVNDLSSEVDLLKTKNRELKRSSDGFESSYKLVNNELNDVTKKYNLRSREVTVLSTENIELKTTNKRLRDENNTLRTENDDLKDKNKKLKTSVDTLMANTKK